MDIKEGIVSFVFSSKSKMAGLILIALFLSITFSVTAQSSLPEGWRLPTEWEWQAVADFDGSWEWGCGTVIHNGMANYKGSAHPDGTTIRGTFGSYGYGMCNMAGNVEEWTSSEYAGSVRIIRDGYWGMLAYYCRVAHRPHNAPSLCSYGIGFRPVIDLP